MAEKTDRSLLTKIVKRELRKTFPGVKFSVTNEKGAYVNSIRIHYSDGVTVGEIARITEKYKLGYFNGLTDSYERTNERSDIPQCEYISIGKRATLFSELFTQH